MCCPLVFEFSVGIGGFVIGLGQISFFFSLLTASNKMTCHDMFPPNEVKIIRIIMTKLKNLSHIPHVKKISSLTLIAGHSIELLKITMIDLCVTLLITLNLFLLNKSNKITKFYKA